MANAAQMVCSTFMDTDRIGSLISNLPLWLRIVGCLAAPLLLFCLVEGYYHTWAIGMVITQKWPIVNFLIKPQLHKGYP